MVTVLSQLTDKLPWAQITGEEYHSIWRGDANAHCPQIFKKCLSDFIKTCHFKRKIHFFSGEGLCLLLRPLPGGSTPRAELSLPDLSVRPQKFKPAVGRLRLEPEGA